MTFTWTTVENIASVSGVAGNVLCGVVGLATGYQALGSPYTTLQESWQELHHIKERLEAIKPERVRQIEAAAAKGKCRSLKDIQKQFQDLWDSQGQLCKQYEESSLPQRHFPGTQIRKLISNLKSEVKGLLMDTWSTTQAHVVGGLFAPPPRDETRSIEMDSLPAGSGPGSSPSHLLRIPIDEEDLGLGKWNEERC